MKLYALARKVNKKIKQRKREKAGKYLSPVRRFERFAVPNDEKIVAMTFDDGPMNMPINPITDPKYKNCGLTKILVNIMKEYEARGTFNVIGTTEYNYPDKEGTINKPTWSGVKHDHYPKFKKDKYAGAKNQKELIKLLLDNGHEISNHGYRHVLFGKNNIVYGSREHFSNINEVVSDLTQLHKLLKDEFNYEIIMSRPPHYIDKIPDGFTSYDAYALMGYDYLAASFDGGGWMPTVGDYNEDVRKMVDPIKNVLKNDEMSLNGQIIFQKDGYNMSLMTPVVTALKEQLEILKNYGYRVITVRELKDMYPFEDFNDKSKNFEIARDLDRKGFIIGYKTNEFKPDKELTIGEMVMMTLTKEEYKKELENIINSKKEKSIYLKQPYYLAFLHYNRLDLMDKRDKLATREDIIKFFSDNFGITPSIKNNTIKRFEYLEVLDAIKNK
ncbi:polysaccharide deacetylase family protein [Defluviitalea phaphyphila]|uniref:polysaccharide deacetylase family protein n=1 Tax=Defluviitalea phaphyphila TaxID=1473580 RepID=UPI00073176BD|nr:polysaccharide deacetylase family protein [Defluviitalea phaphyphila]